MNKMYQAKMAEVRKEEKRHLRASKKVPRTFQHIYEMEARSEEQLGSMRKEIEGLKSLDSSLSGAQG